VLGEGRGGGGREGNVLLAFLCDFDIFFSTFDLNKNNTDREAAVLKSMLDSTTGLETMW